MSTSVKPGVAIAIVAVVAVLVCGLLWKVFMAPKGVAAPPPYIPRSNAQGDPINTPTTGGAPVAPAPSSGGGR